MLVDILNLVLGHILGLLLGHILDLVLDSCTWSCVNASLNSTHLQM